jgi:hypothetical protein
VYKSQAELAAQAKQQAEMDKIRRETHAARVQANVDLQQGIVGDGKALKVLRHYYGAAAMAQLDGEQPAQPDKELAGLSSDRSTADTELSAVMEYSAKIKERLSLEDQVDELNKLMVDNAAARATLEGDSIQVMKTCADCTPKNIDDYVTEWTLEVCPVECDDYCPDGVSRGPKLNAFRSRP